MNILSEKPRSDVRRLLQMQMRKEGINTPIPDDLMTAIETIALALAASAFQVGARSEGLAALDWNRLLAGDSRALDPGHQPAFDKLHDGLRGRWMLKNAGWYRCLTEDNDHLVIPVAKGADLSCLATREEAVDKAMKASE